MNLLLITKARYSFLYPSSSSLYFCHTLTRVTSAYNRFYSSTTLLLIYPLISILIAFPSLSQFSHDIISVFSVFPLLSVSLCPLWSSTAFLNVLTHTTVVIIHVFSVQTLSKLFAVLVFHSIALNYVSLLVSLYFTCRTTADIRIPLGSSLKGLTNACLFLKQLA